MLLKLTQFPKLIRFLVSGLLFSCFALVLSLQAAEEEEAVPAEAEAVEVEAVEVEAVEEEEEEDEDDKEPLMYYAVEPNILTFYQGTGKKIGYVVVQVNIAVRGQDDFDLLDDHIPLVQDNLIKFFNRQDKAMIQPFKERDKLRLMAKTSVMAALREEIGKNIVENLLFTDYVYQ